MMPRLDRLAVILAVALVLALPAAAQLTYTAGRCDGSVSLSLLEATVFQAAGTPTPQYLWVFVESGAGNALISDGSANVCHSLYLAPGGLYLFGSGGPFYFQFQDDYVVLLYGGANLDGPTAPVCGTGSLGPSIFLADERLNVQAESSNTTSLQLGQYTSVQALNCEGLPYLKATSYSALATASLPSCSGPSCCSPDQAILSAPGSASVSVFRLDAQPAADFDYVLASPGALQAQASADPTSGDVPLAVSFSGTASGGVPPYAWDWNFGDGTAHSTSPNPTHTYAAAGTFQPVLKVTDGAGAIARDTHLSILAGPGFAATAAADPTSGVAPLDVAFTGSASGGSPPYTYTWDFKDGSTSTDQNPSHTYSSSGTFAPTLTVQDSAGLSATDGHLSIKVTSPAGLVATAQADTTSGIPPFTVNFTGQATGGRSPYAFAWTFGDGSPGASGPSASRTYTAFGRFTVVLTVQDSLGTTATDSHLIISSQPFLLLTTANPPSGPAPLPVQFAVTVTGGTSPFTFSWDFGDGASSSQQAPLHVYSAQGLYPVTLTVTDGGGRSVTDASISIQVAPPVGTPQVTQVKKLTDPFRLKILGSGFEPGCTVLIDGRAVPGTAWKSTSQLVAKGGASLKAMVPQGQAVCVAAQNFGGSPSECFTFTR